MSWRFSLLLALTLLPALAQPPYGFGRPVPAGREPVPNLTIFPDGRGLPPGKGTAAQGAPLFARHCAECHNDRGEGRENQYPALKGGIGSLASPKPVKSVGSYWPYATTLWDVINRSMPFDHPRTLRPDEVYALTAFVLNLNGIVTETQELNQHTLPKVTMPNRHGFTAPKDRRTSGRLPPGLLP